MGERDDQTIPREVGISGRDLKRGAVVVGTLAWAAPAIKSLGRSARPQDGLESSSGTHPCCICSGYPRSTWGA